MSYVTYNISSLLTRLEMVSYVHPSAKFAGPLSNDKRFDLLLIY